MIKNSQFFIPKIKLVLQTDILSKAYDQNNTKKVREIENILSKSDSDILKYYTDWMKKSYTYGGNLEIIAFRRMMNVNVYLCVCHTKYHVSYTYTFTYILLSTLNMSHIIHISTQ